MNITFNSLTIDTSLPTESSPQCSPLDKKYFSRRKAPPRDLMGVNWGKNNLNLSGKNVSVLLVDVDYAHLKHPDLQHILTPFPTPFPENSHATNMAGQIAGKTCGIAPNVFLSSIPSYVVKKLLYLAAGTIVNMSITLKLPLCSYLLDDDYKPDPGYFRAKFQQDISEKILDETISKARKLKILEKQIKQIKSERIKEMHQLSLGCMLVLTAGNYSTNISEHIEMKSRFIFFDKNRSLQSRTVIVMNVEPDGKTLEKHSSIPGKFGRRALCAMATDIRLPCIKGFETVTGTSGATAQVTGVAALVKEAYPTLTSEQLSECILRGATPIFGPPRQSILVKKLEDFFSLDLTLGDIKKSRTVFGQGLVNLPGALVEAEQIVKGKKTLLTENNVMRLILDYLLQP